MGNREWGTESVIRWQSELPEHKDCRQHSPLPTPHSLKAAPGAVLVILLLLSCSRGVEAAPSQEVTAAHEAAAAQEALALNEAGASQEAASPIAGPRYALIPSNARPGEPVTVACSGGGFSSAGEGVLWAALLDSRGRRLSRAAFFSLSGQEGEEELRAAVLAVPSTAAAGNAVIRIEAGGGTVRELPFIIDSREFRSETVQLNQGNTDLRTVPDPKKTAEAEQLWAVLSKTGTEIYSGNTFAPPVASTRRTSFYGDRRIYQYANGESDTSIHAGIDYGVPTGTEVKACAAGKVVLARNRIVTGNTVILEHLPGLYSLYYHMDSINVSEGSVINAGSLLGFSGSTGLATGPHLHWEIRVSGENTDPDAFLAHPILDKSDIINKLTSY